MKPVVVTAPAVAILLAVGGFSATCAPVHAHEWYPVECCAGHDCTRANSIVTDRLGDMTVVVGDRRIEIPARFVVRVSPDSQIHICFQTLIDEMDGSPLIVPSCLFLPAQS